MGHQSFFKHFNFLVTAHALPELFYSEGIAFYLAEIWDYKFSKCWRYGLGRSPNLGVAKEANILANIWKFFDGCIGHVTWQRECTTLIGKVLSAWVLLNKVYTYMHTHIIPCKPTPITLSVFLMPEFCYNDLRVCAKDTETNQLHVYA